MSILKRYHALSRRFGSRYWMQTAQIASVVDIAVEMNVIVDIAVEIAVSKCRDIKSSTKSTARRFCVDFEYRISV